MRFKYIGMSGLVHVLVFAAAILFLPLVQPVPETPPRVVATVELMETPVSSAPLVPVSLPALDYNSASDAGQPAAFSAGQGPEQDAQNGKIRAQAGSAPSRISGLKAVGENSGRPAPDAGSGIREQTGSTGGNPKIADKEAGAAMPEPVTNPSVSYAPEPDYPIEARREKQEGRAVLSILVGEDGSVESCSIEQSTGYDSLDQAALQAVGRWRFLPARRGNQPISKWILLPVSFNLH